jgi:hypothetical protein
MASSSWKNQLNGDPLSWLLEPDPNNPGVRLFTLIDLLGFSTDSTEVRAARSAVMQTVAAVEILAAQAAEGYWVQPGAGYWPKYKSTVWSVIFLAQLGADGSEARVKKGCAYALDHCLSPYRGLSVDGTNSGLVHCLQGNLSAALIDLGWFGDERLAHALDWLAQSVTGTGIAPAEEKDAPIRYYRSGNSAPGFACAGNNHLPCAWGAVKAALALSKIPPQLRTDEMQRAIAMATEFLLSGNPVEANYPQWAGGKPNRSWFQFGYPIGYVTDVLQNLTALAALGCAADERVAAGKAYILSKQDVQGRWKMEYTYNGKTWVDVEQKGEPSKWITFRALSFLKSIA